MPVRSKPPRLVLWPERRDERGKLVRRSSWVIVDGDMRKATGFTKDEQDAAEALFKTYLTDKHAAPKAGVAKPAADCRIADVLTIYLKEKAGKLKHPDEAARCAERLIEFWGERTLAAINPRSCEHYAEWRHGQKWAHAKTSKRTIKASGWHELKTLLTAINYHRRAGYCSEVVYVTAAAPKPKPRERFLTPAEAARLIWAAWRMKAAGTGYGKKRFKSEEPSRPRWTGRHLARFILVGLWTGSRHDAIAAASFTKTAGRGYIDLDLAEPDIRKARATFQRLREGEAESSTKKAPTVPIPMKLLPHLRRWHQHGFSKHAVVEWQGKPIKRVKRSFRTAVIAAGLDPNEVVPHTLRHTAATWMMQEGIAIWQAAGFLGMSEETLRKNYGHHHPDFMEEARDFGRNRKRAARARPAHLTVVK